jgi:crotonobetainyl-CoA:carnitine CoA-transferase CaiB-like acyl-CoA transferase
MMGSELAGVKVADFSAVVAGPYCTRLMARFGADVIKIEPPEGDHLRSLRPLRNGDSAFFGALNAGKRSVVLDLRTADGKAAARKVVDWADVVVENFRPGVMARFGLDYITLARQRPELVYCSVSGYGQVGPWITRPAIAAIVHATSGYDLALASYQPGMSRPPVAGIHTADVLSAGLALSGVLTALRAAERTGTGRHVDVSMLDSMLSLLTGEVMSAQFPGEHNVRGYPPARTSDGFVMIGAVSQRLFEALMTTIGRPELIDDPRFKANADRWAHAAELDAVIEEWTAARTGDECEAALLAAGVPASKYRTVSEQFGLEQAAARNTFASVSDASGEYQIVDSPFHLHVPEQAAEPATQSRPLSVPGLGADTRPVLEEFLGPREAARLIAAGVALDGSKHEMEAR